MTESRIPVYQNIAKEPLGGTVTAQTNGTMEKQPMRLPSFSQLLEEISRPEVAPVPETRSSVSSVSTTSDSMGSPFAEWRVGGGPVFQMQRPVHQVGQVAGYPTSMPGSLSGSLPSLPGSLPSLGPGSVHQTQGPVHQEKRRRGGRKKKASTVCTQCELTQTPEWRRGPQGLRTLCNACGLYYLKLLKRFGEADAALIFVYKRAHNEVLERVVPDATEKRRVCGGAV